MSIKYPLQDEPVGYKNLLEATKKARVKRDNGNIHDCF